MWKDFSDIMVFEQWLKEYKKELFQAGGSTTFGAGLWMACWLQRNEALKKIIPGNVIGIEVRELVEIELFTNLWAIINLLVG